MDFEPIRLWLTEIRNWPWSEVKSVAELVLYYLTVLAVLGCLLRLGAIGRILRDFREARGPLWELKTTVNDLKELEPAIRLLGRQVALVDDKVEAARKQVAELQVESISTRSDSDQGDSSNETDDREAPVVVEEGENRNWLMLRDYWQRNRRRIEYIIDQIDDGRTKLAYDRLPRTNYKRILNKLQAQGRVTEAAANASRELNSLFNRFRPRNRSIPDEVVESLQVLDEQLERELVPFARVLAAEIGDESSYAEEQAPTPATVLPQYGATDERSIHPNLSGNPRT
jgi:hypothetical protein